MVAGTATTYDLVAGVIVEIEPLIRQIAPTETPMQNSRGADGRLLIGSSPTTQKKFEWQDDSILTPRSTLASGITAGDTTLTVAAGEQLRFGTGHVLVINDEQLRVTGYGSTDELTVTRGFNSTTAAIQANASAVLDLGVFLGEGSDPSAARSADWNNKWNMVQIKGPEQLAISITENMIPKYGLGMTQLDYQAAHRAAEMAIMYETTLLYGQRMEDSGSKMRQTGGLHWWITNNGVVDSTTTTLTETLLLDQLETLWGVGGSPTLCMLPFAQKRKISQWDSGDVRLGRDDDGRGNVVEYLDSDAGRLYFLVNRWIKSTDMFIYNSDQLKRRILRPMQLEALAKTGDSRKAQVVGEEGLQFVAPSQAGAFTALT